MKLIPLTQGQFAMVNDEDFEWLNQWKWCTLKKGRTLYAVRNSPKDAEGKKKNIYMHRVILGAEGVTHVDHVDGNGLNDTRANLRFATKRQNAQNSQKQLGSYSSSYKGVSYYKRDGNWSAHVHLGRHNGKPRKQHLGYFFTEEEAARAYDKAALEHYGDFARLNFPL